MSNHDKRTYSSWHNMKNRCNNPKHPKYKRYGGRGITYDPKWETFEGFFEDMGVRPENRTLDRFPNHGGNYCKDNCRWATRDEQSNNKETHNPVKGVMLMNKKKWFAYTKAGKEKRKKLYYGVDFFEAVCRRKSYENSLNGE